MYLIKPYFKMTKLKNDFKNSKIFQIQGKSNIEKFVGKLQICISFLKKIQSSKKHLICNN